MLMGKAGRSPLGLWAECWAERGQLIQQSTQRCEANESRGQKRESHSNEHCLGEQHPITIIARTGHFNLFFSCLACIFWMSNLLIQWNTININWGQWELSSVCINHQVSWKIKALHRQVCQSKICKYFWPSLLFQKQERYQPLAQSTSTLPLWSTQIL